jgi:phage terminase small subunit
MPKATPQSLTDMQQAFVANYLITLSATKAAIAAGYSKTSAGVQGYQLLQHPSIARELRRAMARRAKRLDLTAENVLREIARIAFSDIRAVMTFDGQKITVKASDKIHSDAAAAIQSIEQHTTESERSSNTTVKVKLHDKMRALDLAGRHLGMWAKGDDDEFKRLSLAELLAMVRDQLAKLEVPK